MKNINFTCPFCSLLCDDIKLEVKENKDMQKKLNLRLMISKSYIENF